jgi:hypothetical protein
VVALPKKDKIDPFVLLKPSFTSINYNDEINNHSFQTISNSCLISLTKAYIFN